MSKFLNSCPKTGTATSRSLLRCGNVHRDLRAQNAAFNNYAPKRPGAVIQLVSLNSSRPISMRRISEVPAPISYSLASRSRRPAG